MIHQKLRNISLVTFMLVVLSSTSWAASGSSEERSVISNGNGVSSPSFTDGLHGQNPAGLAENSSFKVHALGAGYNSSFDPFLGGVDFLFGNGLLGAGVGYNKPFGNGISNNGTLAWGLAGRLQSMNLALGFSGNHFLTGGGSRFDFGLLYEPSQKFRFGFTLPDLANQIDLLAFGFMYQLDPIAELVLDADYSTPSKVGVIKPGLNFYVSSFQISAAYGLNYTGTGSNYLTKKLTAGMGFKVTQAVMLSYEYQGLALHRIGLTMRLK